MSACSLTDLALKPLRKSLDPSANINQLVCECVCNFFRVLKSAVVRFHDLRHTAATRLVGAHIPLSEVGRVLRHTQANTTYRYVNANIESARRAAAALDMFNAEGTVQPEPIEMVN
jgi:hypothetical protein